MELCSTAFPYSIICRIGNIPIVRSGSHATARTIVNKSTPCLLIRGIGRHSSLAFITTRPRYTNFTKRTVGSLGTVYKSKDLFDAAIPLTRWMVPKMESFTASETVE